ncbi:MAG: hypothetical protein AABX54_01105, partial [Nanoarchaeota archaeon]
MEPYTKHYGPLEEICDLIAGGLVLGALLSGGAIMNYISHRDNPNQKIEQSYESDVHPSRWTVRIANSSFY